MALRNFAVAANGVVGESINSSATLIAAADTAVDDAVTANAAAGAKADVSTELGVAIAAIAAISANIPSGALVVSVDTSQVTSLNHLRSLLDSFVASLSGTNMLPPSD